MSGTPDPDDNSPDDPPEGSVHDTMAPNPVPFVVALVGFVLLAVFAFVYLREDDAGEIVRPERIERIDDLTVRVRPDVPRADTCTVVDRAQADFGGDTIYLELVVQQRNGDEGECDDGAPVSLDVIITLPEPIDGRRLLGGVGRYRLPCSGADGSFTCAPQ